VDSVRTFCTLTNIVDIDCNSENDITDVIEETFSVQEERFGELVTIELKPGGADVPVTEENKAEFVE
jgi:HECT-domain (ubiquitin-transferase)